MQRFIEKQSVAVKLILAYGSHSVKPSQDALRNP